MRFAVFALLYFVSSVAFGRTPQPATKPAAVRITVVNMSGQKRQLVTTTGRVTVPVGGRVELNTHVGCHVQVVSDMDSRVDERVCVGPLAQSTPFVLR